MKKVTKKELEKLNKGVESINKVQKQIGGLEIQKHQLLHVMTSLQDNLSRFHDGMKDKYGDVTINTMTGEIIEDEPAKKD